MENVSRNHYYLSDIEMYLRFKEYPKGLIPANRSNFRRGCKKFSIRNGEFLYDDKRLVIITDKIRQREIVKDIHEGVGTSSHSKATASHKGRDVTLSTITERFFWYAIRKDIDAHIRSCEKCQKQGELKLKSNEELHSIPIPSIAMKQVGVALCNLPEVNGYKYLIVCIDYFTKWSEAKPIKDKHADTIAQFMYELMCRHGCFATQINYQGREFVNGVTSELHRLTGIEQRVTSAYHPQSNGLVERQNRTIKNSLVKVLDENPSGWPFVVEGVLFAHRVSKHSSTKFSPFKLLYNRDPVLPIDIKYQRSEMDDMDLDEPFDKQFFEKDYCKRHANTANRIQTGVEVLLRNNKRKDRKGGKFC